MASSMPNDPESINEATPPKVEDIYSVAFRCRELFISYSKREYAYTTQVAVCQSRFLAWASFLGVFARESVSLDRRLEFEPDYKALVLAMLRVLERNLHRSLTWHTPEYLTRRNVAVEDDSLIYGITGAIDRLHRIAEALRQSPRTDEVARVRNFISKQKPDHFPEVITAWIQFVFPDAEETLQTQLVESIVYRRYRMLWSRRHSKKLGQQRKTEENRQPRTNEAALLPAKQSHYPSASTLGAQPSPEPKVESVYSSTLPSKRLLDKKVAGIQRDKHDDHRSARSSNPPPRARYPPLPSLLPGESKISCPYCLTDITTQAKKETKWRHHLDSDLQPYVCVSEECRNFPTSFSTRKEWRAHMNGHGAEWARHIHRVKWTCTDCGDDAGSFPSEDLLVHHFNEDEGRKHSRSLNAIGLARIKIQSKKTDLREVHDCPLCGPPPWNTPGTLRKEVGVLTGNPEDLPTHFADHLQQLALLSISWWDEDIGAAANSPNSDYGTANTFAPNSAIGVDQEEEMGSLVWLGADALAEKDKIRDKEESQSQLCQEELVEQQKQLWELLQPGLERSTLTKYQRFRDDHTLRKQKQPNSILEELHDLHEQLRRDAEALIPQTARLDTITGQHVEPPYTNPIAISEQWKSITDLYVPNAAESDPVLDHMIKFAMSSPSSPKRFALLIGIDLYLNDGSRKLQEDSTSIHNLNGCVNDANDIRELLRDNFGLHEPRVLTSSATSYNPSLPQEPEDRLPTFQNIKREIESVSAEAQTGDLFFIYFSGHGAVLSRTEKSPQGRGTDPSLITADYFCGKPALRGWQLNEWLRTLNLKKIHIVVVLDSSHSGGSWRTGKLPRSPENWKAPPNLPADEDAVHQTIPGQQTHHAKLGVSWDLNPEGFTVMTACQRDQLAAERMVDGKVNGAFTYALLEYFKTQIHNTPSTYHVIRQYIASRIAPQAPQVFGRDRLTFFGNNEPFVSTPLYVKFQGNTAQLPVGKAHGIKTGAEYIACYPTSEIVLSVYEVGDFESQARTKSLPVELKSESIPILPLRWSTENLLRILVDPSLSQSFETQLEGRLAERIVGDIDVATSDNCGENCSVDDTTFRLKVTEHGGIDIFGPLSLLGYAGPVRGLRTTAASDANLAALSSVTLGHLFRFQQILDLRKEASRDAPPFKVVLEPSGGTQQTPFTEKQKLEYSFENCSQEPLYFTVMVLGSGLDVMQLFPSSDLTEPVLAQTTRFFSFQLTVADELKNSTTANPEHLYRDIIRTVVTTGRQLSLKSIELPEIWQADQMDHRRMYRGPRGALLQSDFRWWIQDNEIHTKL